MTATPPIRILIVDDHAIVRQGLALLLDAQPGFTVVGDAGGYDEALEAAARLAPDAVLVDLTLKDRSGLDLLHELKQRHPHVRTLVLSMHDETAYAERALKAGARGYVMKEHADEVLVEALHNVMAGEVYVSPLVSAQLLRHLADGEPPAGEATGVDSLTEREREVFDLIGRGYSTKRIAEQLALSARTVDVHRANIKKKLRCEDFAQVLREAVRWVESQPKPDAPTL